MKGLAVRAEVSTTTCWAILEGKQDHGFGRICETAFNKGDDR